MKKRYTILAIFLLCFQQLAFGQIDTLVFENFENDPTTYIEPTFPNGDDETWVNYDQDGFNDGSGTGRPGEWFWTFGFADIDTSTLVFASNSWTSPANLVANYLILPPLNIQDASAQLSWKSAPYQTPRYLDGYYVVVSTDCNVEECFTDTLFKAAEYLSVGALDVDSGFSHYTFSSGWVHGEDGTYTEYHNDSARFVGVLQPQSVSLAAYVGQKIYIAIVHGSKDDNLLSVDDILVTQNEITGIHETTAAISTLNIYPNPSHSISTIHFNLNRTSSVTTTISDITGRIVKTIYAGVLIKGNQQITLDVSDLAAGNYDVVVQHNAGKVSGKIVVQ
ncbi:MAG: T9SS type A sorting domain-containing protein [Chitinophagales bacterium]